MITSQKLLKDIEKYNQLKVSCDLLFSINDFIKPMLSEEDKSLMKESILLYSGVNMSVIVDHRKRIERDKDKTVPCWVKLQRFCKDNNVSYSLNIDEVCFTSLK